MKDILDLLDRPISFNRAYKRITGSTVAALMLSQAWYWSKRTKDPDGWFYKVQAEWEEETGLTRSEQETARKNLKEHGFIEEELRGIPARLYYRVNKVKIFDVLGVQFAGIPHTCMPEAREQDSPIPANINIESETTTEITSPQPETSQLVGEEHEEHPAKVEPSTERTKRSDAAKKGDLIDGLAYYAQEAKARGEDEVAATLDKLERGLHRGIKRTGEWQDLARWIIKQGGPDLWIKNYMADAFNARTAWRLIPDQIRASWVAYTDGQSKAIDAGGGGVYV